MALKIRLRRQGRTNRPFYRLVVTEVTARRDGKYVEALGWYDPLGTEPAKSYSLNEERIQHWLDFGAQLSESVEALVARGAPKIMQVYREKVEAHKAKMRAKRRASKARAEG